MVYSSKIVAQKNALRRVHFEQLICNCQRSSHVTVEPSHGYLLPWFCLKQVSAGHLRSWPHPFNLVCTCVWRLFEGGYYFFHSAPSAATIRGWLWFRVQPLFKYSIKIDRWGSEIGYSAHNNFFRCKDKVSWCIKKWSKKLVGHHAIMILAYAWTRSRLEAIMPA